jgi:O-acetylhomoserine (thiol)-lyase
MAFTFHSIAIGLRDLGMTMNPQGAHYTLMGIETLGLRMRRHVENAQIVAEWLEQDPRVGRVTYPGLKSSPYNKLAQSITPKGPGALFTLRVKGGYDACVKLIDNVKLFSHVANLGDTRSLIIHSASTTHRQLSEEAQVARPERRRMWCGFRSGSRMSPTSSPIWIRRWQPPRPDKLQSRSPHAGSGPFVIRSVRK